MWIRPSKVYVPIQALNDVEEIRVLLPHISNRYPENYVMIVAFLLFLYTKIYYRSMRIAQSSYVPAADTAELHPLAKFGSTIPAAFTGMQSPPNRQH